MLPTRKNIRAKWDNYQNGSYFITVCTQNKQHFFGEIQNNQIKLSKLGTQLNKIILDTLTMRSPQYIDIPIYTIMPNHFHLIITINTDFEISQHYFQNQSNNLASIIRGIKSSLTSFAIKNQIPFQWQSRYHDRIIRNQTEFDNIYRYIENNVINWKQDCFYITE